MQLALINWATKEDLRNRKGIIYRIYDKLNNKSYIGKTLHSFARRYKIENWWENLSNQHLKNRIKKYGEDNFCIHLIQFNIKSNKYLLMLENYYARHYNTYEPFGYNQIECGKENPPTPKIKTILLRNKDEKLFKIENIRDFCRKNKLSRANIRNIEIKKQLYHKEWHNPNFTLNECLHWTISSSHKNKLKCIKSPDGKIYFFLNIRKFAKEHNLDKDCLIDLLKGRYKRKRGYMGWNLPHKSNP